MSRAKVKVLNEVTEEELEEIIDTHLEEGYRIQDSEVEWYLGLIRGVYVFVKEDDDFQSEVINCLEDIGNAIDYRNNM